MPPNPNPMHFYFGSLFIGGREIQELSWRLRPEFVEKDPKHESYVDYSQYMRRYPPPEQFGQRVNVQEACCLYRQYGDTL
ncbi:uncharacterized protein N7525_010102 [Penicillium rubens]|jgi:hypothetical protein|uniref:uncharacterized protein n=1 Tax=Penicillium rubens TaxID=1108849 RepID=UPI002A59DE95|nr:uncharacterized protein N7525_010102 [Penicillium rubens]KAJ5820818.1 hypothetical protein N7525_010102 [Penicillium rubens]KAJ5858460.1 hypothetical protein N7534_003737 [Penicillium rubens]